MGASSWVCFTPYHPKPATALRQLREQIFAAGQYRKPASVQESLARLGPLPLPSELHRQTAEQLRRSPGAAESPMIQNLIAQAERLAEEAAKREPEYRRLMEALRAGTLDSLPEVQEWNARAGGLWFRPPGSIPAVPQAGHGSGRHRDAADAGRGERDALDPRHHPGREAGRARDRLPAPIGPPAQHLRHDGADASPSGGSD